MPTAEDVSGARCGGARTRARPRLPVHRPAGSGKRDAARASPPSARRGAADPDRRAAAPLADPSAHPDLAWLRPPGAQHLVDDVRER